MNLASTSQLGRTLEKDWLFRYILQKRRYRKVYDLMKDYLVENNLAYVADDERAFAILFMEFCSA